jgi:hypothetical protein
VSKKTEKPRKPGKNNQKNRTLKKKPIKILKKPTCSVRFYKPKTKKTETEQKKNRAKLEKNQVKPVSVRFWFFF